MRAVLVNVHGQPSWTVIDATGLPVTEIEQFLCWLPAIECSANTVRSHARHLSPYDRWLTVCMIDWNAITFAALSDSAVRRRVRVGGARYGSATVRG